MINQTDIAYIAGLFDGEGSINITRRPERKKKHKGEQPNRETTETKKGRNLSHYPTQPLQSRPPSMDQYLEGITQRFLQKQS